MKYSLLPLLSVVGLFAAGVWLFNPGHPASPAEVPAEVQAEPRLESVIEERGHPGWYEQWFEMKKNSEGIIPRGLHAGWARHDREMEQLREVSTAQAMGLSPIASTTFLGPTETGGRTRSLLIDSADENRIFAGAISGGMWRSSDGGATWTAIDDMASSLAVSCITQSPFEPSYIYYGTGETRANSSGVPGDGVFVSVDGGDTFTQLASTIGIGDMERCWAIEHSTVDPDTVYVGTNLGLWRTLDRGASWHEVVANGQIADIVIFADGSVMIGRSSAGIRFSPSGDPGTFVPLTAPGFPTSFNRVEIVAYPGNEDIIYAAFEENGSIGGTQALWRSLDRGMTWDQRTTPDIGPSFNTYCFMLGVSPDNPNRLVCAGQMLTHSLDGGSTWIPTSTGHVDHHVFVNYQGNTDMLLLGSDGGVFRHDWNGMSNWTSLNDGYHTTQFYAGNYSPLGVIALGGTQDNGTWRVQPAESIKVFGGDGAFAHVSLQDASLAYQSTQVGTMRRSTDFTDSLPNWTIINSNQVMNDEGYAFINAFQINRADGRQLYCRTDNGLWRTVNRGMSWLKITGNLAGLFAIVATPEGNPTVWTGGANALFHRIDDAATAPTSSNTALDASVPNSVTQDFLGHLSVHPSDNTTLYAGFSNFTSSPRAWKVTNADGNNPDWINISGDLPPLLPVNSLKADPSSPDLVLFAATDFGLYYTENGGVNWIKEDSIPSVSIHQAQLRESDRSLFLFTHGRGIWHLPLAGSSDEPGVPYCFGDGSGTACPCSNDNDGSVAMGEAGCATAQSGGGAVLAATGVPSISSDSLNFAGSNLPAGVFGLVFQGTTALGGGQGAPLGRGLICAGGSLIRLPPRMTDAFGNLDTTGVSISMAGNVAAGETRYYQLWFRDPGAGTCGSASNLTNAYEITWLP